MRVPNVIKSIPPMIVRALPTLYYFGCFASKVSANGARKEFENYLQYFRKTLVVLNEFLENPKLERIIEMTDSMDKMEVGKIPGSIYDITLQLSQICQKDKARLEQAMERNNLDRLLEDLFEQKIKKRKIIVADNGRDIHFAEGILTKLREKCHYDSNLMSAQNEKIAEEILKHDFLVFTSAANPKIHELVDWLKSFKKPGLVLANWQKDDQQNQQIIRNGSWLRQRGIYVLFRIYTPLRLFTTIDKIYMKHLCQAG